MSNIEDITNKLENINLSKKISTYTDKQITETIETFKNSSYYEVMKKKHEQNIEMKQALKRFNENPERLDSD